MSKREYIPTKQLEVEYRIRIITKRKDKTKIDLKSLGLYEIPWVYILKHVEPHLIETLILSQNNIREIDSVIQEFKNLKVLDYLEIN